MVPPSVKNTLSVFGGGKMNVIVPLISILSMMRSTAQVKRPQPMAVIVKKAQ
jgi:hypothetical protein